MYVTCHVWDSKYRSQVQSSASSAPFLSFPFPSLFFLQTILNFGHNFHVVGMNTEKASRSTSGKPTLQWADSCNKGVAKFSWQSPHNFRMTVLMTLVYLDLIRVHFDNLNVSWPPYCSVLRHASREPRFQEVPGWWPTADRVFTFASYTSWMM